jgi:hypothetical protein
MSARIYNIHWHGPFKKKEDVKLVQQENGLIYELYLLKGKIPYAKKSHYYCGQSYSRGAGQRLFDGNHHIKDYRKDGVEEIWIGYISNPEINLQPSKLDVDLVEHMLISYLTKVLTKDYVLNKVLFDFPIDNVCILNQWYKRNTNKLYQRTPVGSPSSIIPDVLLHTYDETCNQHELYGAEKIKQMKI